MLCIKTWWQALTDQQKKLGLFALGTLGVILGIIVSVAMRTTVEQVRPAVISQRPGEAAKQVVLQQLHWADEQASAGLEPQLAAVREFFAAARRRTRNYGEAVLSWDSKWQLASSYVTSGQEHARYLQTQFDQTLFTTAELDQLVRQVIAAYLQHTQDVESQMLVRIQADWDELPTESLPPLVDQAALQAQLAQALDQAASAAQTELGAAVGREFVSLLAAEVLTMAAAQLATSAGILGTGVASGAATLGVGVVVGLVVDALVTEIYHQQFDPAGKLAGLLNEKFSEMERLILQGTSESPGLELRLQEYTARRNAARRDAVQQTVLAL